MNLYRIILMICISSSQRSRVAVVGGLVYTLPLDEPKRDSMLPREERRTNGLEVNLSRVAS